MKKTEDNQFYENDGMTQSTPSLPANRAFVIQFRAQPQDKPLSWEGRIEHMVSGEATRFQSQDDMYRFIARVRGDAQADQGNA